MPLLRKGSLLPVLGADFSKPATFLDDRNGFPTNMRYYRSELRKRPGKSVLYGIINDSTQIMGLGKLELSSGIKKLVRNSKAAMEVLNTTTQTWDPIAHAVYTGGDDDFFSYANVTESGLLLATNGVDAIRKYSGSGADAVLGGNPPLAKYIAYCSPYVLVAYTDDGVNVKPWGISWCDTDSPEVWTGGNSGSALLSKEPSAIQNIIKLNEFVIGYKKESLYLGRPVDTSEIFSFDLIKTGLGLDAPRAVAEADGLHYFQAANDFYSFNGIREQSIGGPVRDEVFSRINREKIGRCHAVHIQELNEIWFFVVIAGYDWPTEVWKYNYRFGFWYMDTCDNVTAALKWQRTSGQSWDDDPGTWDSDQGPWDAGVAVQNWEDIVFGLSTGYVHTLDYTTTNDNGVAVSAFFIGKDFIGDALEFTKRWLKLDVWARGPGKLYVDYSIDEGSNWINIPYTSSTAYLQLDGTNRQYSFWFDVWGDKIRFRFRNAESGETFFLRNYYPYYLVREEKR